MSHRFTGSVARGCFLGACNTGVEEVLVAVTFLTCLFRFRGVIVVMMTLVVFLFGYFKKETFFAGLLEWLWTSMAFCFVWCRTAHLVHFWHASGLMKTVLWIFI